MIEVDEACTSETRSWDGSVKVDPGGAAEDRSGTGFEMDRDVNGARRIFCGLSFVTKGVERVDNLSRCPETGGSRILCKEYREVFRELTL